MDSERKGWREGGRREGGRERNGEWEEGMESEGEGGGEIFPLLHLNPTGPGSSE